jgi:hypothetical protein
MANSYGQLAILTHLNTQPWRRAAADVQFTWKAPASRPGSTAVAAARMAVTRTVVCAGGAAAMGGGCTDRGQYGTGECGDYDAGARVIGVAVTVTGRPVLMPVPVAVTRPVAIPRPMAVTRSVSMPRSVSMAPTGAAELAVVSVAAVCRPAGEGGRAMRFDRAVCQRGMAAAAGTRRRGGDRGQRPGRHCRCRGMRRCRMAPLWYQVRLAGPGLLGRHRGLPGRRRRNRRLPRSRDKGVQPETERGDQRQRHGPAQPAPRSTSGRHHWLTRCGRTDLVPQRRTGGGTSPDTAGRAGRRRRGAWADVASNSSRLTVDNTSGDRQTASYSSTSGPGSAPTALAMPRMCPRA